MIRFKNHSPGFSFIEIIIAIALLTIFGTSLFITQATILSKISKVHDKIITLIELEKVNSEFTLKKLQLQQQKKQIYTASLERNVENLNMKIKIQIKALPEESTLFKKFSNSLKIINQQVTINGIKKSFPLFIFDPPLEEDEQSKKGSL